MANSRAMAVDPTEGLVRRGSGGGGGEGRMEGRGKGTGWWGGAGGAMENMTKEREGDIVQQLACLHQVCFYG